MSDETYNWLNNYYLVGYTEKYGRAWHYREAEQGAESNHYPHAIPVEDVQRRLFNWEAVPTKASYEVEIGGKKQRFEMPGTVWARSDTGAHLGTFSDGYTGHQYSPWLLDKVGGLLDVSSKELGIGSAGLLMGGAVAAVQVEAPDSVQIGDDLLRPFIVACTSFNGKYVTSYKRGTTRVVCDNTLDEFHRTADAAFKVKHTKHSGAKIDDVRAALDIHFKHQEAELKEIEALMNQAVTDAEFDRIVKLVDPIVVKPDAQRETGITRTQNRHARYHDMWENDKRIGNYKNTAWGTIQVFNTYDQHSNTIRKGTVRQEQNILNFLKGDVGKSDIKTLTAIKAVVGV